MLRTAQAARTELEWLCEEFERIAALLTGITAQAMDRPAVQTSPARDRMADIVQKKMDIEERILDVAAKYISARVVTIDALGKLRPTARNVLRAYYLEGKTIQEAADAAAVTYGHARNIIATAADMISKHYKNA